MAKNNSAKAPSLKQIKIDKASQTVIGVTAGAVFIIFFVIFAGNALVGQMGNQSKVITAKQEALSQLKDDVSAAHNLVGSYKTFVSKPQNIIGGSLDGNQGNDGDNGKIVLDALPSKYDFPALITSVQALLSRQSVQISSIGGTDQQLEYQGSTGSATPAPVEIPFSFKITGSYQSIQNVIKDFSNSIRPFQIQSIKLSGDQSNLTLTVSEQTYYQPTKTFSVTESTIQ